MVHISVILKLEVQMLKICDLDEYHKKDQFFENCIDIIQKKSGLEGHFE